MRPGNVPPQPLSRPDKARSVREAYDMTTICETCEERIAEDIVDGKAICLNCRDFNAWCDDTEARWERARAEGKVAHRPALTAPSGLLEVAS